MIFDSPKVLDLLNSRDNGNLSLDSIIHKETKPLIESIAASLCSSSSDRLDFNDLVQEGHLKLQHLIVSKSYVTSRGTLYSFFSFALKNAMIDFIRKSMREVIKNDIERISLPTQSNSVPVNILSDLSDYVLYRFPSIPDYLSLLDASVYITTALYESVYNKSRGIQKTLSIIYDFPSDLSKVLYKSTLIFLKLYVLNNLNYPNSPREFLSVNPSYEMSNIPDVALIVGHKDTSLLLMVFNGMKVML